MIQLEGPSGAAVLLNGNTPDFFVGHVGEFSHDFNWKGALLVPPGKYRLNVFDYGGEEIYSGPVWVNENQRVILSLSQVGEKERTEWPGGQGLNSLPRFKAGIASVIVAVAKPTAQLSSGPTQIDCGGSVQLLWSTSEAAHVEISGVGEVEAWGAQAVQPKQTTSYKLTAVGPGGTAKSAVTVKVNSNIRSSLSVTPAHVRFHKVGDKVEQLGSASLAWSASGADTVSLDPFGPVSTTGNRTIQATPPKGDLGPGPVDETITYTLRSSNACGGSATRSASLHIVGSIDPPESVAAAQAKPKRTGVNKK
jgi:hypothetical protein